MTATHDQARAAVADLTAPVVTERRMPRRLTPDSRVAITRGVKLVALAAALGVLYVLGALLPFWFLSSPAPAVVFFPSAGLTIATLLLSPRRLWPLWLFAFGLAEFSVDITHHQTALMALGFAIANTAEPYVGARLVVWNQRRMPAHSLRARMMPFIAFGVIVGPFVGAFIGAWVAWLSDGSHSWFSIMWRWWLGDGIGVLVVATPILAWARPTRYDKRPSVLKVAAFTAVAVAVLVVPAVQWGRPMIFAVLAVLMWAALSGGSPAVSTAGLGVAFAVDWAAITGRAHELVPGASDTGVLVYVQFFLVVTLLAALTLCIEVADRVRAERILNRAEIQRNRAEQAVVTAAEDERRRIARETHDIVGHALNVMLLQAGAARRVIDRDPVMSRALLESIETEGRDAFRDLDIALGLVDRSRDLDPVRGLADLPDLVDRMRRAGIQVTLNLTGTPGRISTLVDWSAYRIAQEALTNVAKHAVGAQARVEVAYQPQILILTIVDDGGRRASQPGTRGGQGLAGMRERVAVLGGEIAAGAQPTGGFSVRVQLPIRGVTS